LAKNLFRGNLTSSQWQSVEQMLDKILTDCMGSMLYNKISQSGNTLNLVFNPNMKSNGEYNPNNRTITLGTQAVDHVLFHEMFHAYQKQKNIPNSLNMEIETWVAQFKYAEIQFGYVGSPYQNTMDNTAHGRRTQLLAHLLDSRGNPFLNTPVSEIERVFQNAASAFRTHSGYSSPTTYPLDNTRTGIDNFTNLAELSTGC
jgi:hypothetical protein